MCAVSGKIATFAHSTTKNLCNKRPVTSELNSQKCDHNFENVIIDNIANANVDNIANINNDYVVTNVDASTRFYKQ
jgi:hypothetical protein